MEEKNRSGASMYESRFGFIQTKDFLVENISGQL